MARYRVVHETNRVVNVIGTRWRTRVCESRQTQFERCFLHVALDTTIVRTNLVSFTTTA